MNSGHEGSRWAADSSESGAGRMLAVLSQRPAGLITDIDGTLSPIAPTPEQAKVSPTVKHSLRALAPHVRVVAAISGRSVADAQRLLGVPELIYVGNHGLESRGPDAVWAHPQARKWQPHLITILQSLAPLAESLGGVFIEDKGLSASIHYRLNPSPEATRERLLAAIRALPAAGDAIITEGKMVIEIRPPVKVTKGTAIRELIQRYQLRGVVYLGDDLTDLDAFNSLHQWVGESGGAGLAVAVVADNTPSSVCDEADLRLAGVPAMEEALRQLVSILADH